MLLAGGAATASSKKNQGKGFLQGTENRLEGSFAAQRCSAACPSFFSNHFFSVSCRPYAPQWCALSDSAATLGTAETICALGMLVSSIIIGMVSLRKDM